MSGPMNMEQTPDGRWVESVPLPLWIGRFFKQAQCECGRTFGRKDGLAYRAHWRAEHGSSR